jgi:hypothetical protein
MPGWFRLSLCIFLLAASGCRSERVKGPFEQIEDDAWRVVNKKDVGDDGIFVQATLRTFAYEIAHAYSRAEHEGLGQEQLEYRLKQRIHSYVDGTYPAQDGTDFNSLYLQYLVFVNPDFDPDNPVQKSKFNTFRSEFIRRIVRLVYDLKFPMLRDHYDERWGLTLYNRLVFVVHLNGEEAESNPFIADIGERTFLVDQDGNRYQPSGTAGPYPYESDRPTTELLGDKAYYRVFFPNRRADKKTPIVNRDTQWLELEIRGLGSESVRTLRWEFPLDYPEVETRRLPSEAEIAVVKAAKRAEREAERARRKAEGK